MRITVMCGAGAMSTFVAHRLRRACAEAGHPEHVVTVSRLSAGAPRDADLLLLGAHVPADDPTVGEAEAAGLPLLRLPADVASDLDGTRTLALVEAGTTEVPNRTQ